MRITTKLLLFFLLNTSILSAQNNFFKTAENSQLSKKKEVLSNIKKKRVYSLDEKSMRSYLRNAPMEFKNNGLTIPLDIPLPDGTVETFNMVESPVLSPEIAAQNPDVKTYTGNGTINKSAIIRLSLTQLGFNAIIVNVGGHDTVYFDSYSTERNNIYFNYFSKDAISPDGTKSGSCLVDELEHDEDHSEFFDKKKLNESINKIKSTTATATSSGTQLRTFRLAVVASGEFTAAHGATQALGYAAVIAYVNRLNITFRKELSIHLNLVSGQNLVYANAGTDPFTSQTAVNTTLGTTQTTLNTAMGGVANYDIGHLFGYESGSGQGLAAQGVCDSGNKGRALSFIGSSTNLYGQDFMDNLILHEMGHQFGMSHSYNSTVSTCTSRSLITPVEPGAGATIMSYGFICSTDNYPEGPKAGTILQYHPANYEQAIAFLGNISSCASPTATLNTPPVIATLTNYTIPKSTPFTLTGSATDADNDILSYCWEGTDIGVIVPNASTINDTTQPPFFRTYAASSNPTRTYPALAAILDGSNQTTGDKLPSIAFVTKHSLTVRDNNAAGGGVTNRDMTVTIDGNIGPFLETTNLSGVQNASSAKTITWSVNGTNIATPLVKISLSTDGGFTWPITLASATPNDGSQVITLPNIRTTLARIKIEAVNNVFFDISNVNFTIEQTLTANVSGTNTLSGTSTGSATAAPFGGKLTSSPIPVTRSFSITNFNIDNTAVNYGSLTFPVLPAGSTINSASLNIATVDPLGRSWAQDIRASLTGAYTLGYTSISTALDITVALATVNLPNFITTGGSINLLMYDDTADNSGVEATFASARIDVSYNRNGYTYLWSNGATTPTISGLAAGNYTVTVTDASLATASGSYIVRSEFNVVASTGANGNISPAGTSRVVSGSGITYTFTPNTCFKVGSVLVNGVSVGAPSTYTFSSVTANSTISVSYIADPAVTFSTSTITACTSYTWPDNGQTYTTSGTYTGTTTGCTTQRLILTITPSSFQDTTISACSSYTWSNNNQTYASSGTYIGTTTNCITQRLILTITPLTFQNTTISACTTYTWTNNSQTYTSSGTYFGTTSGCVTQRLILTITPSSIQDTTISACGSYTWTNNNLTYTSSGTYTGTTINCATQRLILTITPSSFQDTSITSCDSYTWPNNSVRYTTSGTYTGTTTNCVTQRLNLTITPSSFQTTAISACDSYVWNGTTYTATGIYNGTTTNCVTPRLNLTITPSSFQTTTISACDSYVWNGTTYTATGIYNGTTTNCVTQRLNLTITPSSFQTTTISACDSYVWNGTTYTATGIYTGTTTNCITERLNLTINRTIWNGSSWSNGVPNSNTKAIISGNYSQAANLSACSLDITGTAVVNVPTGFNFNISGKVTVASTASLIFANNSNLIQVENIQNTGNITINRDSNPLRRLDFTLWSSPVTNVNQFITSFSPLTTTTRFYSYNESTNLYNVIANPNATTFDLAKGYLIRVPNIHPDTPTIWAGSFTGIPNNGIISKPVTYSGSTLFGYNLVGNPYPSSISADAFVTANASQIEGSLYFWRKVNAAAGTAYAVYTKAGSTKTASSDIPNGIIQAGQGFFVKAKSGATSIAFSNVMRVADNSNQFFKSYKETQNRLWLNLSNTSGAFSQLLIGYFADATAGIDDFDAKYINDSALALTSTINNQEYSIQGRPMFDPSDIVALNFKTDVVSDYTISIGNLEGVFEKEIDIYLVDSKTGLEINLKKEPYTFAATTGLDNKRFLLKYQKSLTTNTFAIDPNEVIVYKKNKDIHVKSTAIDIQNIIVFDVLGRKIAQQKDQNTIHAVIKNIGGSNQVLILKITLKDNKVVNKKITL